MAEPVTENPTELYARFSRRGMFALLGIVLVLGSAGFAAAIWPRGAAAQWLLAISPYVGGIVALIVVVLSVSTLRGLRLDPRSPEARAVLADEWRQANLGRAARGALAVVLIAQVPLAFLLVQFPAQRAVIGMAVGTITLGMASLLALFLYFDRE